MTTKDEALRKALEALNHYEKAGLATIKTIDAITAIKEVLAQPQQKPVAWMKTSQGDSRLFLASEHPDFDKLAWVDGVTITPLYPPDPPHRKPLTDEEISRIWGSYFSRGFEFARAIEAAHGIKEIKNDARLAHDRHSERSWMEH